MSEPTLGSALRAAREAAGLSVEDVSARTCIRGTVVRDLEADRVTSSGGAVYARGHVKSICAVAGVDPAPFLERFARQYGAEPVVALAEPEPLRAAGPVRVPKAARPERRGPNWTVAGAAAVVVLAALFVVGQAAAPDTPGADTAVAQAPASASPSAAPRAVPVRAAPVKGAALSLRLTGTAWISVRDARGRTLHEGVLRAGARREFRDTTMLRLAVGNAGAVRAVCSGRDLGALGRTGAVRRLTCTRQGIAPA